MAVMCKIKVSPFPCHIRVKESCRNENNKYLHFLFLTKWNASKYLLCNSFRPLFFLLSFKNIYDLSVKGDNSKKIRQSVLLGENIELSIKIKDKTKPRKNTNKTLFSFLPTSLYRGPTLQESVQFFTCLFCLSLLAATFYLKAFVRKLVCFREFLIETFVSYLLIKIDRLL